MIWLYLEVAVILFAAKALTDKFAPIFWGHFLFICQCFLRNRLRSTSHSVVEVLPKPRVFFLGFFHNLMVRHTPTLGKFIFIYFWVFYRGYWL